MREKLIELLGLKADASDTDVVARVQFLKENYESIQKANVRLEKELNELLESTPENSGLEKKIATKIAQSQGALNRAQAIVAIEEQEKNNATRGKRR